MGIAFDTAKFLANVKRDCFIATSDGNWSDQNIMGVGDDCLLHHIAPILKSTKQDWFRDDYAFPFVAGQSTYDLSDEAMWFGVDSVHLVNVSDGSIASKLVLGEPSARQLYETFSTGVPAVYWLNQTSMTVEPTPDATTVTQFSAIASIYRRPAQMCLTTDVATITALHTGSVTLSATPSFFTANATAPYSLDIYNKNQPHTRKVNALSVASLANVLTAALTTAQAASLAVGDVVSLHGTSCYPDIPPEIFPALQKLTAQTILTAQTDPSGLAAFVQQQQADLEKMVRGMMNRNDGQAKKMSLYHSPIVHTARRYWLGWPVR